jgi:hypothetical protein
MSERQKTITIEYDWNAMADYLKGDQENITDFLAQRSTEEYKINPGREREDKIEYFSPNPPRLFFSAKIEHPSEGNFEELQKAFEDLKGRFEVFIGGPNSGELSVIEYRIYADKDKFIK